MQFGTFFMMKARQNEVFVLTLLFNLNLNHREIQLPKWRLNQNFWLPLGENVSCIGDRISRNFKPCKVVFFAVLAMLSRSKLAFSSPETCKSFGLFLQHYQNSQANTTLFPGLLSCCPIFQQYYIQFCTTDINFLDITNVFQMWLTLVVIRIS